MNCKINKYYSGVCSNGTKGCEEYHGNSSALSDGLNDPDIAENIAATITYGINNICVEKAGMQLPIFAPKVMTEIRAFIVKTLRGI